MPVNDFSLISIDIWSADDLVVLFIGGGGGGVNEVIFLFK